MGQQHKDDAAWPDVFKIVGSRNTARFRELMAAGLDPRKPRNQKGESLLTVAMDYRADEIATAIIDSGVELLPEERNIVWAVLVRRADLVEQFIEHGADVNER
jgi:hypothetical protein